MVLAQTGPEITDNAVLDEWVFPFGEWIWEIVRWTDQNLKGLLSVIRWPFDFFLDIFVSEDPSVQSIPWIWLVIAMFLIASFSRNVRVGVGIAVMLTLCGLLGPNYWPETAKTIGMIFVAVLLCGVIGIPLGILSGRFDGVWNVVRPTLDAMQVVHSFVYMLPFIFFWGIGEVPATMVTMVFALPPLVRLTNLGIRQVPEDVVEAARAYGAPELRVLTDVQLPLARPAIMTGLNQTLLMSISMLGIAAIMGAGGLGLLVFRAINNLNVGLAASAGLALFIVAVVLDRISQREDTDGMNLWVRVREAWAFKADPEGLMELREERLEAIGVEEVEPEVEEEEKYVEVGSRERLGLLIAAAGGALASVSTLMPWNGGSGAASGWSRRFDQNLADGTVLVEGDADAGITEVVSDGLFGGLEASGGSWFGYVVLGFSLVGFFWALRPMLSFPKALSDLIAKAQGALLAVLAANVLILLVLSIFDAGTDFFSSTALAIFVVILVLVAADTYVQGNPRAGADGVALLGVGALGTALAFTFMSPNPLNVEYTREIGSVLAIIGTAMLTAGGVVALMSAEYSPRRPLPVTISWGRVFGAFVGLVLVVGGMFASWVVDERTDVVITPELQQEIDDLRIQAEEEPALAAQNAQIISNLVNSARRSERTILYGWVDDGPRLGILVSVLAGLGLVASVPAAGLMGGGEKRRWQASAILGGMGLAVMAVAIAWVASLARTADPKLLSGAGTLLTAIGGFLMFASGRSVLNEFRRKRVYADYAHAHAEELVHELEGAEELELLTN